MSRVYATVASNTRSSEMLHTSTSSIRLGSDEMVITQLVPTNVVPVISFLLQMRRITHLPPFQPGYIPRTRPLSPA